MRFGGRGFQVRSVSANDIAGAVEVRGVLEGLAARLTAERGLSAGGSGRPGVVPAARR